MATISDVLMEDSNDRVLALDKGGIDYGMTRDRSLDIAGQRVDRFSCKDTFEYERLLRERQDSGAFYRVDLPPYRAWMVGQVHQTTAIYNYRLLSGVRLPCFLLPGLPSLLYLFETAASNCYVVTLRCPDTANERSREIYGRQASALRHIVENDMPDSDAVQDQFASQSSYRLNSFC